MEKTRKGEREGKKVLHKTRQIEACETSKLVLILVVATHQKVMPILFSSAQNSKGMRERENK